MPGTRRSDAANAAVGTSSIRKLLIGEDAAHIPVAKVTMIAIALANALLNVFALRAITKLLGLPLGIVPAAVLGAAVFLFVTVLLCCANIGAEPAQHGPG